MEKKAITQYFKMIVNILENKMNKEFEKMDLTASQTHILIYLFHHQLVNQRDIEYKFNLSNPTVNGILNRLEKKDLIKRIVSEKDARFKEIHLTDKSYELEKKMKKSCKEMEKQILDGIDKEELDRFYKILDKILNNIS